MWVYQGYLFDKGILLCGVVQILHNIRSSKPNLLISRVDHSAYSHDLSTAFFVVDNEVLSSIEPCVFPSLPQI